MSVYGSKVDLSEFVRDRLKADIYRLLRSGQSIKLVGIPEIGISTIMRTFWAFCLPGGDFSKEWFAFYIDNHYKEEEMKTELLSQAKRNGGLPLTDPGPIPFVKLCIWLAEQIQQGSAEKKILFILDNFQKNFASQRKESILTESTLLDLHGLVDAKTAIHFMVNYKHPLHLLLGEDWYLNNFATLYIGLLSLEEAELLVKIRRKRNGLFCDEITMKKIQDFAGRHPLLLDRAAGVNFEDTKEMDPTNPLGFVHWIRNRYAGFIKQINMADERMRPPGDTLEKLKRIVENPNDPQFQQSEYEFARQYCYEVEENGRKMYCLLSKGFEDFLLKEKPESLWERLKRFVTPPQS